MPGAIEVRASTAAAAVAEAHGLACGQAVVIHAASNVLVHLRPAPVVARVMTGTVALHDDPSRWLTRELSVLEFLAPSGLAVAPSRVIAPGPHCQDGLWMTFTEWIPDVATAPGRRDGVRTEDARELGRALRSLHDHLRPFDGELGSLRDVRDDIERLLARLPEREPLALRLERAGIFDADLPSQALHGDVSLRNRLRTPRGPLWNDFEDTFRGPLHWDVASAVGSLRMHGADEDAERALLDAYGWEDPRELAPFLAAQDVYGEIWRRYVENRRPAPLTS